MIAIINFTENEVIPKETCKKLGIISSIKIGARFGIRNDTIQPMNNTYQYYEDEVIQKDGKYYSKNGEKVESYYVYKRIPNYDEKIHVVITKDVQLLVDIADFTAEISKPFMVNQVIDEKGTVDGMYKSILRLSEKMDAFERMIPENGMKDMFNQKCNVHVAGNQLITYNDLKLLEDVCTDTLQGQLNAGWRIIAVCVQPDQRRPDYILGRYNPNITETEERARRE